MNELIDGKIVPMKAAAVAAKQAEWAAEAAKPATPKAPSLEERLAVIEDWATFEKLAAQEGK